MEYNIVVLAFEEDEPVHEYHIYSGPTQAENFLENVQMWQEQGLYEVADAVTAVRDASGELHIKQTKTLTGKYALGGTGVGFLAGLLLGGPIGGMIGGAAIGAVAGKLKDSGIDDKFIKQVSEGLALNTSALFLMGKAIDEDKLMAEIRPFKALIASTTLPEEREKEIQDLLKREE